MAVFVSLWVYEERGMKQDDVVLYVIESNFLKPFLFLFLHVLCVHFARE